MIHKVIGSHSNLLHNLYLYINLRNYFLHLSLHFIVFAGVAILEMTNNDPTIFQKIFRIIYKVILHSSDPLYNF